MSQGGKNFQNVSATTAQFPLFEGIYVVACSATWGGGSVILGMIGPDGTTVLPVTIATGPGININGITGPLYLPSGQYVFTILTATAVYVGISAVSVI